VSHLRLKDADEAHAVKELRDSKARIEAETGFSCRHFCAPFGIPNIDFDPDVHPGLAARAGYRSFLTTQRGINRASTPDAPAVIRRDHFLAAWSPSQIRYFFGA
jgi:peptidoglycan/xylan/chitin deacetylase (PgdA/CDA1 family)